MQAVAVITRRRRRPWPLWQRSLLGFGVPWLLGDIVCALVAHPVVSAQLLPWVHTALAAALLILPWALRPRQVPSAFAETLVLTRVSAQQWIDHRLGTVLRRLLAWTTPAWLTLCLLQGLCDPSGLVQVVAWLPTVAMLTALVGYGGEVRSIEPWAPGLRRLAGATLAVCGGWIMAAWAGFGSPLTPTMLLTVGIGLGVLRYALLHGAALSCVARPLAQRFARARRPFRYNPIVVRESFRTARRGRFGALGMGFRRLGLLVAILGIMAFGDPPFMWVSDLQVVALFLTLWGLASPILTYWTTAHTGMEESHQGTGVLLSTSEMSWPEYARGWIAWAMRARWFEAGVLLAFGLLAGTHLQDALTDWDGVRVCLSAVVTSLLANAAAARAGLAAAQRRHSTWSLHMELATWLVCCWTMAYQALEGQYWRDVGFVLTPIVVSLAALVVAEVRMRWAFAAPGGVLGASLRAGGGP